MVPWRHALSAIVVALAAGALPATGQIAAGESCSFDAGGATVTAVVEPGGEAKLKVAGGQILFGAVPQPCGAATTTTTDLIRIAGHAGTSERLVLDQRTGVFGPGAEPETNIPEIEIEVGLGDEDSMLLYLTDGDDRVAAGQNGLGLNADGDVDVTVVDSPARVPLELHALDGDDLVTARGTFGAGLAYLGPVVIHGGADDDELIGSFEDDVLRGGPGEDELRGHEGDDLLKAGAGDDELSGGEGGDTLVGGPGLDSFAAGFGDDVLVAADLEADTQLNGGPGTDVAYWDDALDAAPAAVEQAVAGDDTPPQVTCTPDDGWHGGDATVPCTAGDVESALPDEDDETFGLVASVPAGTESADATTGTREVCNGVGLCTTAGPVAGIKIDRKAPANPERVRSTDRRVGKWSRDRRISVAFGAGLDGGSGVDGFAYAWTTSPGSGAGTLKLLEETARGVTSPRLGDGRWYFHLATVDNVGNWSEPTHLGPLLVDGTRPRVQALEASGRVGERLRLRYRTADASGRTRERITLKRGGTRVAAWSRKLGPAAWPAVRIVAWRPAAIGMYRLCVQARDAAGNGRAGCARVTVRP